MNHIIGINSGATKSVYTAADSNLKIIHSGQSVACNLKKDGIKAATALIENIVDTIIATGKVSIKNVKGICAGFAGAGRNNDAENLKGKLQDLIDAKYGVKIPVIITTDALITLEGAFNGGAGAVLISGTGSIIFAKDGNDIFYRAGGFGRIIGDEGSGYSIGRKGLASCAKLFDSRGKDNLMAKYIKSDFNINTSEELIRKVYDENFEPSEFAPYVIKAAEGHDDLASKIVNEEIEELLSHIKAVKIFFENKFKLSLSGGILSTENYFAKLFKERMKLRFPNIELVAPVHPPEIGALLLIKKKLAL